MDSKKLIIIALVAVIALGGFYLYQEQQSEKISVNIGGNELSIEAQ